MKVKKAVQKIAAIGAGLSMVGATILGAMAADLSEYPDPLFVKDGQFNGVIVVGDKAAAEDVVGAINVATSLQYAVGQPVATPTQPGGAGGVLSVSGDAVPISEPNDMLEIRENLGSVRETLTEFDLAGLQGGTVVTDEGATDYNQYLRFEDTVPGGSVNATNANSIGAGSVVFEEDEDDVVGDYLKFDDGDDMFEYELEFEEGVESSIDGTELDDLEDEELNILGKVFAVVDTRFSGTSVTLELLGGDVLDTMEEGETRTYTVDGKEYEVNLLIVSDNLNSVKFVVNGEVTDELEDGETDVMRDGIEVGIRDILPNEAEEETGGDLVEFFLGANKIELSDSVFTDDNFDSGGVEVHEEDIEDGRVKIKGTNTSSTMEIQTIQYRLRADSAKGNVYIPPGHGLKEYLDEPEGMLSDIWDIRYEGLMDTGVSIIRFDANGDDSYDLQFTNREGLEYDVPFVDNSRDEIAAFKYGDEDDDLIFNEGLLNSSTAGLTNVSSSPTLGNGQVFNFTAARTNNTPTDICGNFMNIDEDDYFVLTDDPQDETSFTHVLTYEAIDTLNNEITFNDQATGQREVVYSTTGLPNTCLLGAATTLIVGGNTYDVYISTGQFGAGNNATGKFPIAVDQNADGLIDGDEIRVIVNGGGILDLGTQFVANTTAISFLAAGIGWLNNASESDRDKSAYRIGTGTTDRFLASLATLASEFDGNGVLDSGLNENVTVNFTTASGNTVDLDVRTRQNSTFNSGVYTFDALFIRMESLDEEDLRQGLTSYGAFFEQTDEDSTDDAEDLTIEYPLSQRGADVFVVFGETQTSRVSGATGGAVVLNPINVGAAKLASEVAGQELTTNMVLVGGPCINSAAAKAMGSDEPLCGEASGIAPGTAVLKLFEHGDTVSLLVAGYDKDDTRRATKVLAEYRDWADKLVGKEVVVTGTSMSDIDVSAPTATP